MTNSLPAGPTSTKTCVSQNVLKYLFSDTKISISRFIRLTTRGTYQYKYSEEDSLPKGVRAGDVEDGLYEDSVRVSA